jgi:hypothetical protein
LHVNVEGSTDRCRRSRLHRTCTCIGQGVNMFMRYYILLGAIATTIAAGVEIATGYFEHASD